MPRGRKKVQPQTVEERIAAVTAEMEALKEQLKEKKNELKELQTAKEAEDQKKLLDAFAASGKSVEEVLAMLGSKASDNENSEAETAE
ncbi:MAG: hypothetical protein LUH58_11430 [Lachnospiraceae bacterium]|nr:hypothetical protein [Lachnospiraceae bacterium]